MQLTPEKQALLDTPIPPTQTGTPFDLVNTDYNISAFKPILASSRDARSTVANAVPKLDAKIAQVTGQVGTVTPPSQTEKTAKDVGLEGYTPAGGIGSKYTSGDGSKWVFSNNGWVPEGSVASTSTGASQGTEPWNANQFGDLVKQNLSERERLEEERATKEAEFLSRLDATQRALVESIEKKYEARRLKMEDINQRMLAGKTIAGAQSGRMRYAASMQEGVLTTEELDGQARLAEIDAEELSAIAQAKATYDEKSYNAFIKNMDRLDQLNREKMDTIQMLYDKGMEQDKLLYERRRQAIDDGRKTLESVAYGITQEYGKLTTEEERKNFIENVAEQYSLDPMQIYSKMMETADAQTKQQLEREMDLLNLEYKRETINTEKAQQANYYDQINKRDAGNETDSDKGYTLTQSQKSKILALGTFSEKDVNAIESDLKEYGLSAVIAGMDAESQKTLKVILGGGEEDTTVEPLTLDATYIEKLFTPGQLKTMAEKAGYRKILSSWDTEKSNFLNFLVGKAEAMRAAGKSDEDIIKELTK